MGFPKLGHALAFPKVSTGAEVINQLTVFQRKNDFLPTQDGCLPDCVGDEQVYFLHTTGGFRSVPVFQLILLSQLYSLHYSEDIQTSLWKYRSMTTFYQRKNLHNY